MYEGIIIEKLPPECEACRRQRELQEREKASLTVESLRKALDWFMEEVNRSYV